MRIYATAIALMLAFGLVRDAVGAGVVCSLFGMSGPARVANLPSNRLGVNPKYVWGGRVRITTYYGSELCDFDELQPGDYHETVKNGVDVLEATPQWYARRQKHAPARVVEVRKEVPDSGPVFRRPSMYRIISCEYDSRDDSVYRFELQLNGGAFAAEMTSVKRDFAEWLKNDYGQSIGETDLALLRVEFLEYKQAGTAVYGRARIEKIGRQTLKYDAETGIGVMSVRIGNRRLADVRSACIQEIEHVVRDKNVARVTGEDPSEAMYFILNEEVKDNGVLEIQFKTQ